MKILTDLRELTLLRGEHLMERERYNIVPLQGIGQG